MLHLLDDSAQRHVVQLGKLQIFHAEQNAFVTPAKLVVVAGIVIQVYASSETAARRAVERALAALQAKPYPQWQSPQARALALRLPLAAARNG